MDKQNFQYQKIFDEIKYFFEPTLSEYGFVIAKTSMPDEAYGSVNFWFQKGQMQVIVSVDNLWDYPRPYLNIIFLYGTSITEYSSFPLWQLVKEIGQSKTFGVYSFDSDGEFASVAPFAVSDLRKYAVEILNGDVEFFRKYQKLHREFWQNYYIEQALKNKYQQRDGELWIKHYKEMFGDEHSKNIEE